MTMQTDDLRILDIRELVTPERLMRKHVPSDAVSSLVCETRHRLHKILHGTDRRLAVVIGPCSIHDVEAAREYARLLARERKRLSAWLEIVMRVYFEKPRTIVGWKGLINDPNLDQSFQINRGLHLARQLLIDINEMGVPAGCEFLDMITPQYIADLVSWGAIGARTTESQVHRELASGLSCPVGFKNGTDGNIGIAVDAVLAARYPHHFLSVTKQGHSAIVLTAGNSDCHVILRGGKTPNYEADNVTAARAALRAAGLDTRLMIDASHGNSGKKPENQPRVIETVARQIEDGDTGIGGVMLESHLVGGRQDLVPGRSLTYGQSITDSCLDWTSSIACLERLAESVRHREELEPVNEVS